MPQWAMKGKDGWEDLKGAQGTLLEKTHAKGGESYKCKVQGKQCVFDLKKMTVEVDGEKKKLKRSGDDDDDDDDEDDNSSEEEDEDEDEDDDDDAMQIDLDFSWTLTGPDGTPWTPPNHSQKMIQNAFDKGLTTFTTGIFKFDFKAMTATKGKNKAAVLHTLTRDSSSGEPLWEQLDDTKWTEITGIVHKALEAAYERKKTTVNHKGATYSIVDMKCRTADGDENRIRRRMVDTSDAPAPSKSKLTGKRKKPEKESPKKSHKSSKKVEPEEEEDDDDESDEGPPMKKSKSNDGTKKAKKSEKSAKSTKHAEEEEEEGGGGKSKGKHTTTLLKKGRGIVEPHSGLAATHHVVDCNGVLYQCTLNQTNLTNANNNKFYKIQLLESDTGKGNVVCYSNWGRVGTPGSTQLQTATSRAAAVAMFTKKFREKTKNDFLSVHDDIDSFTKHSGKYQLLDMAVNHEDELDDAAEDAKAKGKKKKVPDCTLDAKVKKVMEMITDMKAMVHTLKELEVNTDQMPLGKLSKNQIKKAFNILKQIDTKLTKKSTAGLQQLSADFYTLVPHDFGMCKPTIINSASYLQKKMELLDAMADIEIAQKLLHASNTAIHPLNQAYDNMKCELTALDHKSDEFKHVVRYVEQTKGATHSSYKLEVQEVFTLEREGEAKRFSKYADNSNRMLLWHGSGTSNWMGILSQGLRIAPPEAPVTGYMFGKGVYFADCSTKSANYCRATVVNDVAFMTLNEVALGDMHKLRGAKYMDKAPKGYLSTMGEGQHAPTWEKRYTDDDGMIWPLGKMKKTGLDSQLLYNEFIVYSVEQVRARYMVQLKFNYGA